ncbi:altered inheritance of mitochondria protein 23 [Striga asiatica]|uniref:Altered inheritance of mitochondria protein 23 n=1 Tax=Striga asiatica TaxID=4170 RepID=A0A5A7RC11_STRAF|nr:altered inheritance of mitochondria protein 23 [Striga asiatica]
MDLRHSHRSLLLRDLERGRRRTQQCHQPSSMVIRVLGIRGIAEIGMMRGRRRLPLWLEWRRGKRQRPLRMRVLVGLRWVGKGGVDRMVVEGRRLGRKGVGASGGRRVGGGGRRERGRRQIRVSDSDEILGIRGGIGERGRGRRWGLNCKQLVKDGPAYVCYRLSGEYVWWVRMDLGKRAPAGECALGSVVVK